MRHNVSVWLHLAVAGLIGLLIAPPALPAPAGAPRPQRVRCAGYDALSEGQGIGGAPRRVRIMKDGRVMQTVEAAAISGVECRDVTGDRKPELLVSTFSGGAHCCMTLYVFSLGTRLRRLLRYEGGNAMDVEVRDLDRDGRPELVLGDDTFAYFGDLCYACSPASLPLVACFRGDRFEDCTWRFPYVILAEINGFTNLLMKRVSEGNAGYTRGAALGLYASYALLGQDQQGWDVVRTIASDPQVLTWLSGHRPAVRRWAATRGGKLRP